jgi:hypothetical protein
MLASSSKPNRRGEEQGNPTRKRNRKKENGTRKEVEKSNKHNAEL